MSNATDMLAAYQNAELALLQGQSYRFGDRQITMVNLPEIQAGRREWERRVSAEQATTAGAQNGPLSVHGADFSDGLNVDTTDGWWPQR